MARSPALATADAEASPEADRLEGFPHPRETVRLFGQSHAEEVLLSALQSGRTHHAWLLTGREGIGKATLAYRFARAALARANERDLFGATLDIDAATPTAHQVLALSHPGLLVLRRGYDTKSKKFHTTIAVDEVRRLRSFLSLSAEEGSRRVVIVDSADEMNVNAANALLKSLEEPPAQTIFLIVSSAPGRLLPTIRSRCRVLALAPLGKEDLHRAADQALHAQGKPPVPKDDYAALEPLAAGSVRRLLSLKDGGGLALQAKIDKLFAGLPKLDLKAALALADELSPAAAEQKFSLFYDLFLAHLARLVRLEATCGEGGIGAAGDAAVASRLIGPARLATFAELWETLARDKADALALNLDRKALILDTVSRLEAAARS
jgi:DNA polymerase-3 subunit delta'